MSGHPMAATTRDFQTGSELAALRPHLANIGLELEQLFLSRSRVRSFRL